MEEEQGRSPGGLGSWLQTESCPSFLGSRGPGLQGLSGEPLPLLQHPRPRLWSCPEEGRLTQPCQRLSFLPGCR